MVSPFHRHHSVCRWLGLGTNFFRPYLAVWTSKRRGAPASPSQRITIVFLQKETITAGRGDTPCLVDVKAEYFSLIAGERKE